MPKPLEKTPIETIKNRLEQWRVYLEHDGLLGEGARTIVPQLEEELRRRVNVDDEESE
jgi:hypothetical protein